MFIHLTLVPYIKSAGELKTKPTQHSVKELRTIGIQPDILICRSEQPIPASERRKIALFTNVSEKPLFRRSMPIRFIASHYCYANKAWTTWWCTSCVSMCRPPT